MYILSNQWVCAGSVEAEDLLVFQWSACRSCNPYPPCHSLLLLEHFSRYSHQLLSSRPPTALQTMRLWYFMSSSTRIFHQNCKLSFYLFKGQIVLITRKTEYGYSHMSPPMHSYYIFWRWKYFVLWLFFAWFPADFLQTYGFTYVFSSPMIVVHPLLSEYACWTVSSF